MMKTVRLLICTLITFGLMVAICSCVDFSESNTYLTDNSVGILYQHSDTVQEYETDSYPPVSPIESEFTEADTTNGISEITNDTQATETYPQSPIYSFPYTMLADSILEATKEGDWCVKYDGNIIAGAELWDAFITNSEQHIPCQLYMAYYASYEGNVKDSWLESAKKEYPYIELSELTYDGELFYYSYRRNTDTKAASVKTYKYLIKCEHDGQFVYFLCNENNRTYEQWMDLFFSSSYIPSITIIMSIPSS